MKKSLLIVLVSLMGAISFAQGECFVRLQKAFDDRGSNPVADDMHRNVIVSYFEEGGGSYCIAGKARVENGKVASVFLQFEDGTYELMEKKFANLKNEPPTIINGITEMIMNEDREKFRIVFIDQLKPKKKGYKTVNVPDNI